MKILVVACSPRKQSCSSTLAERFAEGAKKAGHEIHFFSLADKDVNGCKACKYCYSHEGECIQKDDIVPIVDSMRECDMLVLATPTYYYSLPSQTKAVLDRMYARHGKPLTIKKSALLVSLEDSADRIELLSAQYKTAAAYMGWQDMGVVCADGMWGNTVPENHPALKQAYELGYSLK